MLMERKETTKMKQFEYTSAIHPKHEFYSETNWLDFMGEDGWELCAIYSQIEGKSVTMLFYFKREIITPS